MSATAATVDLVAVKSRHSLGGVVEASGIRLMGKGRVRQGVCPFHQETEGSFTVYGDTERWYCFGCGAGGDVLDFVQRAGGLTLPEAVRRLEGQKPAALAKPRSDSATHRPDDAMAPQRDSKVLAAAVRFYAGRLRRSPEAQGYLASRGIGPATASRLRLGYTLGRGLRETLEDAGFTRERVRDSGLLTDRGERFAGMVVVPDVAGGRVRWLAGRAVDPERSPRFQTLPGPKPVLGLGRLGPVPPWAVLAEGVFDWLTLAGWGFPACAALGTQGLEKVAAALRGCRRVLLAFDNDDAGHLASARLAELLGRRAAVVTLPGSVADVADLATRPQGQAVFQRLLRHAARAAG